ncbi:cell division suppressor protein YneA [Clostridium homopropionicum DSM 5847]|uniref:Endolytic murein transglycosylase n=1 Tax=Clostridium homopropionicum DSM 5847 TaxID=1121318 RepID=A0A0L6ZCF9_9CLOT|nr:endolytic transglycosylase MltG [Clostridium homopropionicum]KOA20488.1 cell division suppressor protein YneA [Clostridium homopropionicum DSM 5847]SFG36550.1 UPF0755 protein [Clostridium homopropionicum]
MKKNKLINLLILIAFISILGIKVSSDIKSPFKVKDGNFKFSVNEGDTLFNVVSKLKEKELIKNEFLFKVYIKNNNLNTNIKPGEYYLNSDTSIRNFVEMLNKGSKESTLLKVTIPEGYDIKQIAKLMEEKGIISSEEFINSCKKYKTPNYIKSSSKVKYALEGYLFPDTYEFNKNVTGKEIIDKMLNQFQLVVRNIEKESNKKIDDMQKIITIASIIEKEARVDEDRAKISSVIYNRLDKNMMLQVDATVLYALEEHKNKLTYDDLKIKSPYNTYVTNSLPPGPICSPGVESIKAALFPEKTNYVFYVLEDDKKHFFTNNYNDFLKAKERYKNINK